MSVRRYRSITLVKTWCVAGVNIVLLSVSYISLLIYIAAILSLVIILSFLLSKGGVWEVEVLLRALSPPFILWLFTLQRSFCYYSATVSPRRYHSISVRMMPCDLKRNKISYELMIR